MLILLSAHRHVCHVRVAHMQQLVRQFVLLVQLVNTPPPLVILVVCYVSPAARPQEVRPHVSRVQLNRRQQSSRLIVHIFRSF